jgi:hypothetical protein
VAQFPQQGAGGFQGPGGRGENAGRQEAVGFLERVAQSAASADGKLNIIRIREAVVSLR